MEKNLPTGKRKSKKVAETQTPQPGARLFDRRAHGEKLGLSNLKRAKLHGIALLQHLNRLTKFVSKALLVSNADEQAGKELMRFQACLSHTLPAPSQLRPSLPDILCL